MTNIHSVSFFICFSGISTLKMEKFFPRISVILIVSYKEFYQDF